MTGVVPVVTGVAELTESVVVVSGVAGGGSTRVKEYTANYSSWTAGPHSHVWLQPSTYLPPDPFPWEGTLQTP